MCTLCLITIMRKKCSDKGDDVLIKRYISTQHAAVGVPS